MSDGVVGHNSTLGTDYCYRNSRQIILFPLRSTRGSRKYRESFNSQPRSDEPNGGLHIHTPWVLRDISRRESRANPERARSLLLSFPLDHPAAHRIWKSQAQCVQEPSQIAKSPCKICVKVNAELNCLAAADIISDHCIYRTKVWADGYCVDSRTRPSGHGSVIRNGIKQVSAAS
ncbi:hypothetical protein E6O75_ATG07340 [Venturia nashicola]|uniref:Uncharacterized protein n=1 Tax=Venturia nashicola TaxID=86259 RepID=A0A4Z1NT78_9PEZI|nr:hypothetical protein E6O75_ATG07340 [Venturia nashicola]